MDINVTDKDGLIKEINVKVPYSEMESELNVYYEEERKKIKLDGFRKGKIPLSLVKKMFGKQIEARVLGDLINKYYEEAVTRQELDILVYDNIKLEKFSHEEGLEFSAQLEMKPVFEIPEFTGKKVKKEISIVRSEEVDNILRRIQYNLAKREKSEGPAGEGDFVLMNIQEVDPKTNLPMIGRKWGDRYIRIGDNEIGPEFDDSLKGAKTGDTVIVKRSGSEMLVSQVQDGQTEEAFSVEVKGIDKVELPPLDDNFAKSYNKELKSLEELKNNIKEELKSSKSKQAELALEDSIVNIIRDAVNMEMPSLFIGKYIENMHKRTNENSREKISLKEYKEKNRQNVTAFIKWFLIREKLFEKYDIKIENNEMDERIKNYAESRGMMDWQLKKMYSSKDKQDELIDALKEHKLFEILKEYFKIEEIEVS